MICPDSDDDDEEEVQFVPKSKRPATDQVHTFRNVIERGTIPDAKVIYELKKQRQKLARTLNEDFIALNSDEEETLRQESRLHREDDDDQIEGGGKSDAEDEDEERIQFGSIDYKTIERERAKEAFRQAQVDTEELLQQKRRQSSDDDYSDDDKHQGKKQESDDSEDELDRWEREQIRKAVRLPSLKSYSEMEFQNRFLQNDATTKTTVTNTTSKSLGKDNLNVVPIEIDDDSGFGSHIPTYISTINRVPTECNDYELVNNRKSEFRKRLQSSLEDNKQMLDRIDMDARLAKQSIDEFESRDDAFAADAQFYTDILDYIRNLCDCINDKLELIEQCERDALELFAGQSIAQVKETRQAIQDHNSACLQLVINHKANTIANAGITQGTSIFDFYDFGGDIEKRTRVLRREEQAKRYSLLQIVEGVSEDEDEDESRVDFKNQIAEIQSRLNDIFEDTENEYANLKGIMTKFEAWKQSRLDSYSDSFVGQFIPKFIVYFIRHELALWNLFDLNSPYLDPIKQMPCVRNLILYGALPTEQSDPKVEAKSRNADIDIVPSAVDKAILSKLITQIENGCWNPMSSRQTTRLVRFLTSLLSTCTSLVDCSESLPELFKVIVLRLEQSIEHDAFIPLMIPPDFFSKTSLAARNLYESLVISFVTGFFHRQFWQAIKLLRNILSMRHLIADHVIKELVLEKLLGRMLMLSMSRCSADIDAVLIQVTRIVSFFPEDWCRSTNPVLSKFADLVQQFAEAENLTDEQRKKLISHRMKLVP